MTGRFDRLKQELAAEAPAGETPAAANPFRDRQTRKASLSIKTTEERKRELDRLVHQLNLDGHPVSHYHLIEYWIRQLQDPAVVARMIEGIKAGK
jgi:hypothetical protein